MATKQRAIAGLGALSLALALALAAGCGGDDQNSTNPAADAGAADRAVSADSGGPAPEASPGDAGADSRCDFNGFVTGLIANHTNATDLPSTDLGDECVDTRTPFSPNLFQ